MGMNADDCPLAARAVEGRVAAGYAPIVFVVGDEVCQCQFDAQRGLIKKDIAPEPGAPLRPVGADHALAQRDAVFLQLALQGFEMRTGFCHDRISLHSPAGAQSLDAFDHLVHFLRGQPKKVIRSNNPAAMRWAAARHEHAHHYYPAFAIILFRLPTQRKRPGAGRCFDRVSLSRAVDRTVLAGLARFRSRADFDSRRFDTQPERTGAARLAGKAVQDYPSPAGGGSAIYPLGHGHKLAAIFRRSLRAGSPVVAADSRSRAATSALAVEHLGRRRTRGGPGARAARRR